MKLVRQSQPKWPVSLHQKHFGAVAAFQAASRSIGTGLLGVGMMWAFLNWAEGGVGQTGGRPDVWRREAGV